MDDPQLTGWTFQTTEISPGFYRVDGQHIDGRSVSRMGTSPKAIKDECVADAKALPERRHA